MVFFLPTSLLSAMGSLGDSESLWGASPASSENGGGERMGPEVTKPGLESSGKYRVQKVDSRKPQHVREIFEMG